MNEFNGVHRQHGGGNGVKPFFTGADGMRPTKVNQNAISTWIFPSSAKYATRGYQIQICETALFHNTLVCLPTGLGIV